jgi:DNA-binding NtrC family response regulator
MARIFVIDDEQILLDLVFAVLQLDGHQVSVMDNPVAAANAIIDARPPVDLVISDADMKPISGFELAARIRRGGIACPIVFMSGHHGLAGIMDDPVGRRMLVEKPFTAAMLRSAVRGALEGSRISSDAVR